MNLTVILLSWFWNVFLNPRHDQHCNFFLKVSINVDYLGYNNIGEIQIRIYKMFLGDKIGKQTKCLNFKLYFPKKTAFNFFLDLQKHQVII